MADVRQTESDLEPLQFEFEFDSDQESELIPEPELESSLDQPRNTKLDHIPPDFRLQSIDDLLLFDPDPDPSKPPEPLVRHHVPKRLKPLHERSPILEIPLKNLQRIELNRLQFKEKRDILLKELGNRHPLLDHISRSDNFFDVLSHSQLPKIRQFMMALAKGSYRKYSITALAAKYGISPNEMADLWRDYHVSKFMLTLTGALPEVADRMIEDALSGEVVCPHCEGRKKVVFGAGTNHEETADCPNCKGEGTIMKAGNQHSRDRILETLGLVRKGPGVQVTNIVNTMSVESVIEEMERTRNGSVSATSIQPVEATFQITDSGAD